MYGNEVKPAGHENANLWVLVLLTVAITVLAGIFVLLAIICARSGPEVSDIKIYASQATAAGPGSRSPGAKGDEEDSLDSKSLDTLSSEAKADKHSLETITLTDAKDTATSANTIKAPTAHHHRQNAASSSTWSDAKRSRATRMTSSDIKASSEQSATVLDDGDLKGHHARACGRDRSLARKPDQIYKKCHNTALTRAKH